MAKGVMKPSAFHIEFYNRINKMCLERKSSSVEINELRQSLCRGLFPKSIFNRTIDEMENMGMVKINKRFGPMYIEVKKTRWLEED